MKKFLKISSVILVIGLIAVVAGCSLFNGVGRVVTGVINNSATHTYPLVKAYIFPVSEEEANNPTRTKPANIIEEKKATDVGPGQTVQFTFENSIVEGTRVKLYIGIKKRTSPTQNSLSATNEYYRLETSFVIQEGVNSPEITLPQNWDDVKITETSEYRWWQ